jgi:glycosyltransferase 2 family protein
MTKRWFFWIRLALGIGALAALVWWIGWRETLDALGSADPLTALATLGALIAWFLLGGVNLWILLNALSPFPFGGFLRAYLYAYATGLVAPGQIGDASVTLWLKRRGVPVARSAAAYLLDKAVTAGVIALVAFVGAATLLPELRAWLGFVIGAAALGAFLVALWGVRRFGARLGVPARALAFLDRFVEAAAIYRRRKGALALNLALTFVKWGVLAGAYYLAFLAYGARAPFPEIGAIPALATLVGYLPVSVSGIGAVEATAVYLFSLVGMPEAVTLGAYLLLRVLQYLAAGAAFLVLSAIDREEA